MNESIGYFDTRMGSLHNKMSKGAKGWTDTTFFNSLANFSSQRTCTHSPPLASLSHSLSLSHLSLISFSLMFSVNHQQLFCLSQHRSLIYSRIWTQQCCGILGHAKPSWILPKTNLNCTMSEFPNLCIELLDYVLYHIIIICTLWGKTLLKFSFSFASFLRARIFTSFQQPKKEKRKKREEDVGEKWRC